jgi:hypothetical protein
MTSGYLPSLGSQLDSARAKLRRANQHIGALKKSLKRFGVGDRYENGAKPYDPGVAYLPTRVVRVPARTVPRSSGLLSIESAYERHFFRSIALTITLTPKADFSAQYLRWGVLVGEIVHNLGSALDNLIWELAQPLPSPPPASASSKMRGRDKRLRNSIGFPYTKERKDWTGNCASYLHFIPDPAIRTVLEEAQAFFAWEKTGTDPDTFPLELIHELWNRDKHRTVNVATTGLQFRVGNIRIPSLFPGVSNLPSKVIKLLPMRPLEGETEMAAIHIEFPEEVEFPPGDEFNTTVYVEPEYTLAILFGEGTTAERSNAIDGLQGAYKLAAQVINKF